MKHSEKSKLNCNLEKVTNEAEFLGYLDTHSVFDKMQSEPFQKIALNVAMKKKLCSLLIKLIKGHLLMAGTTTKPTVAYCEVILTKIVGNALKLL